MADIITIDKDMIPYTMSIEISGKTYEMDINYNIESDTFTISLSYQGELLIYNDPMVLDRPMFIDIEYKETPQVYIIPIDLSGISKRVGYEELGETVFLYLFPKE